MKQWIAAGDLKLAPSLMEDFKHLAGLQPGNQYHDKNVRQYVAGWAPKITKPKTSKGETPPWKSAYGPMPPASEN